MVELDSFRPFHDLAEKSKSLLRQGLVRKDFAPGLQILHKGQQISGAYFVLQGRLRVFSLAPNGTEATLYFIDPGETCVFALNSLFNDLLYPAWVQTESQTSVALIPGPIFRALFEQETAIRDMTVRTLATLVFRLMAELEQVHSYRLDHRLANMLLLRASTSGELKMTQQQMADHLGTTREVIARIMRDFVASGYVETRRGLTLVRQADRLSQLISKV